MEAFLSAALRVYWVIMCDAVGSAYLQGYMDSKKLSDLFVASVMILLFLAGVIIMLVISFDNLGAIAC